MEVGELGNAQSDVGRHQTDAHQPRAVERAEELPTPRQVLLAETDLEGNGVKFVTDRRPGRYVERLG